MGNSKKNQTEYSHQLYADELKTHAKLSKLAATASLADVLKFKEKYAKALKDEAQTVRNKKSNFQNDLREGRLEPEYVKPGSKKRATTQGNLDAALGLSTTGEEILKNIQSQESKVNNEHTRKHAGPVIKNSYLSRLRIQSWYLTLLEYWYPDIAFSLREHMIYQALVNHYNALGLNVPPELAQLLPELPPDNNAGDLLEKAITKSFRADPILKNKRYNLKNRNYMAGEGHVTDATVVEFARLVPDSETVYRLGFEGLPMWEVFDGNLDACQKYAHTLLDQNQIESPPSYAQFVLGVLTGSDDQRYLGELVSSLDTLQDGFSDTLDEVLLKYGDADITEGDSYDLNVMGKRIASACLLLLALIQATPKDYLNAHKRLHHLLRHFYQNKLFTRSFGLVFQIYIKQKFLTKKARSD